MRNGGKHGFGALEVLVEEREVGVPACGVDTAVLHCGVDQRDALGALRLHTDPFLLGLLLFEHTVLLAQAVVIRDQRLDGADDIRLRSGVLEFQNSFEIFVHVFGI